jgi:hypothetical protein
LQKLEFIIFNPFRVLVKYNRLRETKKKKRKTKKPKNQKSKADK